MHIYNDWTAPPFKQINFLLATATAPRQLGHSWYPFLDGLPPPPRTLREYPASRYDSVVGEGSGQYNSQFSVTSRGKQRYFHAVEFSRTHLFKQISKTIHFRQTKIRAPNHFNSICSDIISMFMHVIFSHIYSHVHKMYELCKKKSTLIVDIFIMLFGTGYMCISKCSFTYPDPFLFSNYW